jgi:hypothetical protein
VGERDRDKDHNNRTEIGQLHTDQTRNAANDKNDGGDKRKCVAEVKDMRKG